MKKESEIHEEIKRLNKYIEVKESYISSINICSEDKSIYKEEIREMKHDINRLKWVLK